METDHIVPLNQGGSSDISNALPVCFDCHAEIHAYDISHPRGRRYTPAELTLHKEEWLRICSERPEVLLQAPRGLLAGPLQGVVDELEFNLAASDRDQLPGALLHDRQFLRAVEQGAVSILEPELRAAIFEAYIAVGRVNSYIPLEAQQLASGKEAVAGRYVVGALQEALPRFRKALALLISSMSTEPKGATQDQ